MNWYKVAQEYADIAIANYNSYNELVVIYEGVRRKVFKDIVQEDYMKLNSLLKHKNYRDAAFLLKSWEDQDKKKETEEDRQEMLTELYNRGYLK